MGLQPYLIFFSLLCYSHTCIKKLVTEITFKHKFEREQYQIENCDVQISTVYCFNMYIKTES